MGYRKNGSDSGRNSSVRRVLWAILGLNIAVALGKLIYGIFIDSVSMQADGFHSVFDGTSNVVGLIGMGMAARPADSDHPYGHGKYETYASTMIGAMLLLASWKIGSAAIGRLLGGGEPPRVDVGSFVVMGATLAINIGVAWYEGKKGRELQSDILIADASHTGSDILVSVGVLIGLGLVMLGFPLADPIIALLVAFAILWTAWGVLQRSNEIFSDRARLKVEDVCHVACGVKGVLGCHSIRTRGLASQIHVDLHVQVNPNATVAAGHAIAEEVERTVCESLPGVVDVIVHLEPFDEYQYKKTKEELGDTGLASKQSV
jgi:cation diffusion facilitator family transporter